MIHIVMTAAQAASVRYVSADRTNALDPVCLADGETYVLPLAVLTDVAHAHLYDVLSSFPQKEIAPHEWPVPEEI